ncbi:hypothetical protein Cgig2_007296 [Carnegiea gigantea]|uniref:Uncharacterized protein n=1 Tax=Carnegiea gigantea TaxID=171969 RepID=A0A9Q1QQQ9_9CARY|nr:hypothetical protein Cgig2_007296 [Carnegiea gigantea]
MASCTSRSPHGGLLAGLGMGHLIPAVELAKCLVAQHGLTVTIFAVTNKANQAEDELLQAATSSWPDLLNTIVLIPQMPVPPLERCLNADIVDFISDMVTDTLPILLSYIVNMKWKPMVLIADVLWTQAIDVANEFNMIMCFFPLMQGEDLVELTFWPNGEARQEFIRKGLDIATFDGVLVNTFEELESKTLASFRHEQSLKRMVQAPFYPIGPLQRFVWEIRPPKEEGKVALPSNRVDNNKEKIVLNENELMMISTYLPDGYMDRTRDTGNFGPILGSTRAHSHTSSNWRFYVPLWKEFSAIVSGVPIIDGPLHSEQDMNATMLTNEMKIAVRSDIKPKKGLITREEIRKLVTNVMVDKEGIDIRNDIKEFNAYAIKALNEGGSSFNALSKVANDCKDDIA